MPLQIFRKKITILNSLTAKIPTTKFFPQLEGLRAYAILFVVMVHWQVAGNSMEYWIRWAGTWGINYFFVLSGFLIGSILLNEKAQYDAHPESSAGHFLKVFYMRRILRIFPIYYLLVLFLLLIRFPGFITDLYPWLLLYGANIYIFFHGWIWPLSHLWTLSVEEHFIILFPFIIFFVPKRLTVYAVVWVGILGIVCRTVLYLYKQEFYAIFTFSSFDALALGVLLAYFKMKNITIPYLKTITLLAFLLYVYLPLPSFMYFTGKTLMHVIIPSAAIFSLGIVFYASSENRKPSVLTILIQNKITLYIGKIGYGLYVYHLLIPDLRNYLLRVTGLTISALPTVYTFDILLLLSLASLSFYIIEKPIYSLKKHFQYNYLKQAD